MTGRRQFKAVTYLRTEGTAFVRTPTRMAGDRPDFMERLGVLPPYHSEDVKRVFRSKARTAHPDAGGDAQSFIELRDAYERAMDYCRYRECKREWIGASVEKYMSRMRMADTVHQAGGRVEYQGIEPYLRHYGPDFADMLRQVTGVILSGSGVRNDSLRFLDEGDVVHEIRLLVLSRAQIGLDGLRSLARLEGLQCLDLRGTPVTLDGLEELQVLSRLHWIHVGRTGIGYWDRRRLRRLYPKLEVATRMDAAAPRGDFDWMLPPPRIRVLYWRVAR